MKRIGGCGTVAGSVVGGEIAVSLVQQSPLLSWIRTPRTPPATVSHITRGEFLSRLRATSLPCRGPPARSASERPDTRARARRLVWATRGRSPAFGWGRALSPGASRLRRSQPYGCLRPCGSRSLYAGGTGFPETFADKTLGRSFQFCLSRPAKPAAAAGRIRPQPSAHAMTRESASIDSLSTRIAIA